MKPPHPTNLRRSAHKFGISIPGRMTTPYQKPNTLTIQYGGTVFTRRVFRRHVFPTAPLRIHDDPVLQSREFIAHRLPPLTAVP